MSDIITVFVVIISCHLFMKMIQMTIVIPAMTIKIPANSPHDNLTPDMPTTGVYICGVIPLQDQVTTDQCQYCVSDLAHTPLSNTCGNQPCVSISEGKYPLCAR